MAFDLSNYETVEDRLARFWADHPAGRVHTELVIQDGDQVIFKAAVYFDAGDPIPRATGYAEEQRGSSQVNRTSFLENCETSALGRALANCGYATHGKRASRSEMTKVNRMEQEPGQAPIPNRVPVGSATSRGGSLASDKQVWLIKKKAKERGLDDLATLEAIHEIVGDVACVLETLTKSQASMVIEAWQ